MMLQDRDSKIITILISKIERILNSHVSTDKIVRVSDSGMSYNIVTKMKKSGEEKKFIIKVTYDLSKVSREDIVDIIIMARVTSAVPILVSVRDGNEELRDDIAYRKMGVIALSVSAFKKIVEGKPIKFVKDRGLVKARVKGQELRKRREELGLSLGDVAQLLHVSRKTVYEYERGTFEASERTARLLIQYFGEDIIEEVSLEPKYEQCSKYIKNRKVSIDAIREKYSIDAVEAYKLEKAHGKIVVSSVDSEKYLIVPREKFSNEARRVAEVLEVRTLINGD